jgi:hypothetical protein
MIRSQDPTHPDNLIESDLMSEILLVGSGIILFVPLLVIVMVALTQSLSLR